MKTYAWINPEGLWLTYSESMRHTGHHKILGLSQHLKDAYVGSTLPRQNRSMEVDIDKLTAIPATAKTVRTVTLGEAP